MGTSPLIGFQFGLYYPDPVQLIAGVIRIDVMIFQNVLIFMLIAVQPVGIVGDVHFPFTQQLPAKPRW